VSSAAWKGTGVLLLSAILIIVFGLGVLALGFMPSSETDNRTELQVENESLVVWGLGDVDFDADVSVTVNFTNAQGPGELVSFYFIDEDEHDRLMDWVEEDRALALEKVEELESMYERNCSENCSFDFTTNAEGEFYLIIVNHGGEQELTVRVEGSSGIESGVCFVVFLLLVLIAGLMIRASLRIEYERTGPFGRFQG